MARYALVIGISQNQSPLSSLSKTEGDAKAIAEILRKHGDFLDVTLLAGRVLRSDLKDAIKKFMEQAHRNEAVLYYTGHAIAVEDDFGKLKAFLAPSDCRVSVSGTRVDSQQNGIELKGLSDFVVEKDLSNLIMLLDCCHSEFLLQETLVRKSFSNFGKKDYFLISACRDFEQAYALRKDDHSIFTGALLEGLAKEHAETDGKIKLGGLSDFIATRLKGSGQESVFLGYGRSLWLVDYRDRDTQPKVQVTETCPYQGLETFTQETAEYYCGRDRLVNDLLAKLDASAFVPVIGASGSGKSSLVRAGLLPIMEKRREIILGPIKPSDSDNKPTTTLKEVVLAQCKRPGDKQKARDLLTSGHFYDAVATLPGQQNFLLVIDQFEELFTLVALEERRTFIRWVAGPDGENKCREFQNHRQQSDRLRIVMTMRSDFMDQFQSYRQLNALASDEKVCWVGPMTQQELRTAIAEPAQKNGYDLEPGLTELIVGDVEAEPNSLPLLEYALTLLWEQRDITQHRLTLDAYRTLGGDKTQGRLKGALNIKAEEIYEGLAEDERTWTQRLFRRLVRTLPGTKDTRQRQRRHELEDLAKSESDRDAIANVLFDFQEARLLVPDGDYVDLAHEALIDGWNRFATWRQEGRDVQRLVERIIETYKEWNDATDDEKDKYLLREVDVAQVETVTAITEYLTEDQENFVQQSQYKYKPWLDPTWLELEEIRGGTFKMGSPEGKGTSNEKPYHQVKVSAFRMGKYPVTQAQWRAIAMTPKVKRDLVPNPFGFVGDTKPAEKVSWLDAQEFCARLSRLTGQTYRLPSEAEWEYACRAGAKTYTEYSFGDDVSELDKYAWYDNNSDYQTQPVGQKEPNARGLYDMHGNVWEWCEDDWHGDYDGAPIDGSAWIDPNRTDSSTRVLRGGSWDYNPRYCRSACRYNDFPGSRDDGIGVRVCCELLRTPFFSL